MPTLQISSINEADVVIDGCRFHDNNSSAPDVWNSIFQIGPFDDVHSQRLGIEISNSAFYNNHQSNSSFMAIVHALNDTTYIRNCTFAGNSGGSAALSVLGNAVLENNVFWNTQLPKEVIVYYGSDSGTSSRAEFSNNCIRGGQNGVYNMSPQNQVIWHLNNTAADPLFDMSGNAPYRLSAASPLIDAGMDMAYAATSTDAGANERYYDGDGNGTADIDIGAYEYQPVYAPANLVGEVWQQTVYLSWQMPVPERSLIGYRVYRDNAIYADILDPGQNQFRDYSPVNDTLSYYVVALYGNVESNPTNSVTVIVSGVGNEDELAPGLIGKLSISPNPFSDIAVIGYGLNKQSEVELKIYNLKGQLVRTLYKGSQSKGEQALAWEGCDDTGRHVGSGIYLLQLKLDGKAQRAMKLVKF
ncbi:MAG: T9SS type A sorting domain-containing protein [Candidatus Cloacimonetes bacterium]|nr:T9SS type A sorting domain-containing protein [Candidatus Cloacimonadota bacterium]